ncbi:MAG: hypothetical protein E7G18_05690 [Anaerococcus hydrogenalis]|uniref:hypothetical protein n=1 Tax=Anaerococcus hydrogenalis TaxID=33029 RepID=UPI00290D4B32|nr:hypothetical protein [Anaerococcus hydrogenalis]MDU3688161.1 hypothetical protein [Anaerococcus hydrogenalis]
MRKIPEFFKYPEWYIVNEDFKNEIGHIDKRYFIKKDAPDFIKKSYKKYLKDTKREELFYVEFKKCKKNK